MHVTLYAHLDQMDSRLTVDALRKHGIPFDTVSAKAYPATVRAAGVTRVPTVIAEAGTTRCTWSGYRPDLIPLLAELVAAGPLPISCLNDADAAGAAVLTRAQAMHCIEAHQFNPADFFACRGDQPLYRGAAVLHWLGY